MSSNRSQIDSRQVALPMPDGSARTVAERALRLTAWATFSGAIVLTLLWRGGGLSIVDAGRDLPDSGSFPTYLLASTWILFTAFVARRHGPTSAATVVALTLTCTVALGFAFDHNKWNSFPTMRPAERSLADRASLDRVGSLSGLWPAFTALGELSPNGVVLPSSSPFAIYAVEVSEIPIDFENYESVLDPADTRLDEEWLLDVVIDQDRHAIIIGQSDRYRLFTVDDSLYFLAEPEG